MNEETNAVNEEVEVEETSPEIIEEEIQTSVTVADVEYPLVVFGVAQARQITRILRWLGKHAKPIASQISDSEGNIDVTNPMELILSIAEVIESEALTDLFSIVVGCSEAVAMEYFDLYTLIEAFQIVWTQQESYKKIVTRFFSTAN